MAKATKGKGKKKSKGQKKEPSVAPDVKKPKSPPQKKKTKTKFECQHCGKVVSNAHNLKVHEHHCKSKEEEKEKKAESRVIESAVRKLKDEFEDQTEIIQKEAFEREDRLRQELEELKDILRLEIRRGHHIPSHEAEEKPEPEPATDAEQPISQPPAAEPAQDPEPTPEPTHQITEAPPVEIEQPAPPQVDIPITQPEPTLAPTPSPPQEAQPEVQPPVEPPVDKIEDPPSDVEAVPSQPLQISREQVADILKEEIDKLGPGTGMTPDTVPSDIVDKLESLDMKMKDISSDLSRMNAQSDKLKDEMIKIINDRLSDINPKRIYRELEKMSERIFDVMDEVGFGESLNVSKIPPNILEIVYKATLEDVVREMNNVLGQQEAERKINLALEEVRLKTSGSELFRFDGRKIVTENLARTLETNLISAKQIQTTYNELLRKLLETVSNYKAKNFQAMIKIKSQEYAVDRATVLGINLSMLESNMNNMGQMIAAFSSQLGGKTLQLEGEIKQNAEAMESKSDKSDTESIKADLMERAIADRESAERIEAVRAEIGMMKEMMEGLSKQLEELGKPGKAKKPDTILDEAKPDADKKPDKPVEKPPKKAEKAKKDDEPKAKAKAPSKKEDKKPAKEKKDKPEPKVEDAVESKMLEAIAGGSSSKTSLQKKLKLGKKEVEDSLAELVKQKKVLKKGPKNRPTYHLPEEKPAKEKKADKPEPKKEAKSKKPEKEPDVKKPKAGDKKEKKPSKPKDKKEDEKPAKEKEKSEPKAKKSTKPEVKKPGAKAEYKKPKSDDKTKKEKKPEKTEAKTEEKPDVKEVKTPKTPAKKPAKKDDKDKGKSEDKASEKKEEAPAEEEKPLAKSVKELDEAETIVYNEITGAGITLPNLRKKVDKEVKYTAVLRALRVLIDSDLIVAASKGRHTVYKRINIKKTDKTGEKKDKQEVK